VSAKSDESRSGVTERQKGERRLPQLEDRERERRNTKAREEDWRSAGVSDAARQVRDEKQKGVRTRWSGTESYSGSPTTSISGHALKCQG
jgi:hypothetical protein